MTFKRVMLVVLPVMGVIFLFMVLRWLYLDWEASLTDYQPAPAGGTLEMPPGGKEMPVVRGFAHGRTENLNLVRRDSTGRIEMRVLADVVDHRTDKTADINRPRIQFFTNGGEVITLLADKGLAVTKGSLGKVADIESGRLWGNVVLVHDRGTPEDGADDFFVSLEDLVFDNQTYEMSTDGPVVMVGSGMSLSARKMRMALDPQTRRVNTLTFLEDIFVTFETQRMSLLRPTEEEPQAGEKPAAPAPAGAPARETTAAEGEPGDLWRIDVAGDVDARQEDQRLGCDHLSLYNTNGEPGKANEETKRQSEQHPEKIEDAEPDTDTDTTSLLIVLARGPLIITPVGEVERNALGDEQHTVIATGHPVTVEDGETRIVGDAVRFNRETGAGSVIGKDGPVLLEQPGRLRLTGGRLDFDSRKATAEVKGEGELLARVQTAGLTGSVSPGAADKTAAPDEPPPLEASWKRRMRLEFHRLPTQDERGLGEIRRAEFHGQAVVKQADGILKGDQLLIDFFKADEAGGQAVERLVGHGDVFLKNAQPAEEAEAKDASEPAVGDIACQDLDIRFERDAAGATQPANLHAKGDVTINDAQGTIRAQDLTVAFGRNELDEIEVRFLEAFGNVLIDRDDLHAEGDHVHQDKATGTLLLEGKPARATQMLKLKTPSGETVQAPSRIVGPRIEFSDGKATVRGPGELEIPAMTDLRGRPRDQPRPMIVQWTSGMRFEDKRNFAYFEGKAKAATDSSHLAADTLWIYFADRPEDQSVASSSKDPAAPSDAGDKDAAESDGMPDLFGRKSLVRVLAEGDILAVEERLALDGTLRHRMEITGDNLTYLGENRKAYMRGPGRLRILARESATTDEMPGPGLPPKMTDAYWKGAIPDRYARTEVTWADQMAYDGTGERAYFKGNVQVTHAGRGVPGGAESRRRLPTTTRITCRDLQVVFGEKIPPGAATTPPTAPPTTTRQDRMTVEKLVADGDVLLWVGDRRGSSARLLYQREPEMIRLYRGPGPQEWARLWQENEVTQEFGEIAARTITYDPATGRVDVVDQQVMTLGPKTKPRPKPKPKLVPGTKP